MHALEFSVKLPALTLLLCKSALEFLELIVELLFLQNFIDGLLICLLEVVLLHQLRLDATNFLLLLLEKRGLLLLIVALDLKFLIFETLLNFLSQIAPLLLQIILEFKKFQPARLFLLLRDHFVHHLLLFLLVLIKLQL